MFGYSQSNEVIISKAVEAANSQNITTQSQAAQLLEANGLTEGQARQLAAQRGLSYDQLLNEYFTNENNKVNESVTDFDSSSSENKEVSNEENEKDLSDESDDNNYKIKGVANNYFGYNIFDNNPYLNKEYLLGNIDEGYIIAPGDKIRIITYGDNSFEQSLTVDRNGNINIKGYGLFFASGSTFKTLKSRLKIFLGKYLSGLVSTPQKTFMDVSLTELKPTKVVVLGQVVSPGPHILTTSGSALSALYAAGGVKYNGSLREIIIYRNNKLLKKIDLYDYISTGKLKDDLRLTNNDIVFVPNRKNSVEVKGELLNSAIYEFLENEDLTTIVEYSGGILPTTQINKVNIQRIIPANERDSSSIIDRKLITINYQKLLNENKKIDLKDGDQVTFFRILDLQSDQVSITGHVYEPGTYSLKTYSSLKSLIIDAAKGFMPDVYMNKLDVYSLVNGVEVLNTYNLSEVLLGENQVDLLDGDRVIIYNNLEIEGSKLVSIAGFEDPELTINWKENFSLYDIIFSYTQIKNPEFTTNLLETRIDLKRFNSETGNYFSFYYDFENLEKLKEVYLLPKDKVILYNRDVIEKTNKRVSILGYVKNTLNISLEENMYVEDLILLAGGYVEGSDQSYVNLSRFELVPTEERITTNYNVKIDKEYLLGKKSKPDNNFLLKDKDIVSVPKILGYQEIENIKVSGEINFPQNIIPEFRRSNLEYIIEKTGGLTKYANLEGSYLIRNGQKINLNLSKLNKNKSIFRNGDEIVIADSRGVVTTNGALQNESVFIWEKGIRAKTYIKNSGGKTKNAKKAFLINSNGITKKIGFLKNPKPSVNSNIIVNAKIEKEKKERPKFIDTFNNTFQLIASALMSILLAERL
tara:strand:+ start:538 stop:3138 length:2601 start_codon:yes stop_codon:yes gene_type:complete